MNLGQAIRDNRVQLNMTQAELADRIGVSQKVISKYEKGICRPSIENAAVLAHVFGIAVDDLLGGSTDIPEREKRPYPDYAYLRSLRESRQITQETMA